MVGVILAKHYVQLPVSHVISMFPVHIKVDIERCDQKWTGDLKIVSRLFSYHANQVNSVGIIVQSFEYCMSNTNTNIVI